MKYRDELDRSYGAAGMALGLSVFDASDLFTAISLDAEGPGCIQFTPEFFFAGNPRLSPRGAWKYILAVFFGLGFVFITQSDRQKKLSA